MPTPVGHAIVGAAAAEATGVHLFPRRWQTLAFGAAAAVLPDLDFVPGLVLGAASAYHRGPTHAIVAPLAAAVVVGLVLAWWRGRFWPAFVVTFVAYSTHLALDLLGPDTRGDAGIPLLWPFSDAYVHLPIPLPESWAEALSIERGSGLRGFLGAALTWHAARAFALEVALFAPLLLLAVGIRRLRERDRT